ncbi:FliM/FliN family flagellar motor switch protein [Pseudochelatococcus lubricantis]|uniref:FliM/FliN family flagellar motor switch protein n=1 Tax=Pseudochelatococcus lubricantis TaxID=1538102 RepID=UPI0035F04579
MTAMPWHPPALPGIGQSEALWNAILSHAGTALPLAGKAHLVFTPAAPPGPNILCTKLRLGRDGAAYVVWRMFPFADMFDTPLTVDDFPVLPPTLRDALIEGMVDVIRRTLPADAASDVAIAGWGSATADADIVWFDIILAGLAPEPVRLTFGCARSLLLSTSAAWPIVPAAVQAEARGTMIVASAFTLGAFPLTARELAGLTEGTVILLPAAPLERRWLRIGQILWDFRFTDEGWLVAGNRKRLQEETRRRRLRESAVTEQVWPDGESDVEPGLPPQEDAAKSVCLSDLAITIDFDIGERDFTLAEIETWQPGAVVALDPPALADQVAVTLRANGCAVATGDLVAIDDRLAVRLSKILLRT